jgi:myo-inositol 2-dehydrogenase/D-chiro-inositol 1-dehydrogenase
MSKTTSKQKTTSPARVSRRRFLQRSSLALAGAAAAELPRVHAAGKSADFEIKIGLVGCGGRGTGALLDAMGAATKVIYPAAGYHTEDVAEGARVERKGIQVAALADLFEDRLAACQTQLAKLGAEAPKKTCFTGFDAYRRLMEVPEVNYVILATPPHFRPMQLQAAIEAGKNVFMEKPAAVDVPGVKMVMEAGKLAEKKGLGIAAGTQRRHMRSYRETIRRVQEGAIGPIVYAKCYWNGGEIWVIQREPGWSDMEWQIRNWNYFTWLSGDHIVEQHVHNLDVMNWVLGAHPLRAVSGLGGRQVRTGKEHGQIFDHFAVEFEYPGGVSMFSQCRQINGCQNIVGETVVGTDGTSNCQDRIRSKSGKRWRFRQKEPSPYKREHEDLIASIRAGNPINEAQAVAESTMTGILGREAVYSGKSLDWDTAMKSTHRLGPAHYEFGPYPIPEVPMPGRYRFM